MRFGKIILKMLVAVLILALLPVTVNISTTADGMPVKAKRFNMSYVYFGDSAAYTGYVDDTDGSLDDISPSYFDLNEDGSLKLTIAVDRNFINEMHKRGLKVTPFLSNHWNRQTGVNALVSREQLSSQVAAAIDEYNLDGVNVDIENVTETERDSYTDFVRLLRQKLPEGKSLSVAVAPNPWDLTTGWHGSYDYAKLAQYSDYLMLMAYDEHYQGSVSGPVAGYRFVEESISAALKYVPADKLVLGIPFYGRLWKQGSNYGGYGVSNNTAEELIKKYRGVINYDNTDCSPKATITILKGDVKPLVFGRALEAGKYDIWFENEKSLKSKLTLVEKYNLKGTGSWSLGQESKNTWDYYSLWLDGWYFSDIQSNWAKLHIVSVLNLGWMVGESNSSFMPESPVTRAQVAVILTRALGIKTGSEIPDASVFSDTANHWAKAEIEAASANGIVVGTGNGIYEPDKALTREEMAVMLDRILNAGLEGTEGSRGSGGSEIFSDVTRFSSPWSFEAIDRIAAAGILQGYPDKRFYPSEIMTRGQVAALMDRASVYFK